MDKVVRHDGVVHLVLPDGKVRVRLEQREACAGCSIKAHCSAVEGTTRLVDAVPSNGQALAPGDLVCVSAPTGAMGRTTLLAYGLPLAIMLVSVVAVFGLDGPDWLAALVAMLALAMYFVVLRMVLRKVGRVVFTARKREV